MHVLSVRVWKRLGKFRWLTRCNCVQIICAVNGKGVELQINLVQAAATAGNVKQFFPAEFGIYGAVGAACLVLPCALLVLTLLAPFSEHLRILHGFDGESNTLI